MQDVDRYWDILRLNATHILLTWGCHGVGFRCGKIWKWMQVTSSKVVRWMNIDRKVSRDSVKLESNPCSLQVDLRDNPVNVTMSCSCLNLVNWFNICFIGHTKLDRLLIGLCNILGRIAFCCPFNILQIAKCHWVICSTATRIAHSQAEWLNPLHGTIEFQQKLSQRTI